MNSTEAIYFGEIAKYVYLNPMLSEFTFSEDKETILNFLEKNKNHEKNNLLKLLNF